MLEKDFLQQIQENQGVITKLVNLYARDPEEKKDLRQEILYQAWRSCPSFKGQALFRTWLYRICLNTIFTCQRKKSIIEYQSELPAELPSNAAHSDQWESTERLYWAMRQLQETDRAIVTLHLEGYENPEIADMLGITVNNTTVKLFRIKQQLVKLLTHA